MPTLSAGTHFLSLQHQQRERKYVLHVPATGTPPYPLVLAFHGAGGTARIMLHHSRWSLHAEQQGFVVLAPQGTPPQLNEKPTFRFNPQLWNLGSPMLAEKTHHADDVGLVQALLHALPQHIAIDPKRIYATGFSNGAGLCFLLASEMGDQLAAIAPVAGLPSPLLPKVPRLIPTCCYYASADPLIPWQGGEVTSPWSSQATKRLPVLTVLHEWVTRNGFEVHPQTLQQTDLLQEVQFARATNGSEVMYTLVNGLGHHWPGGKDVGVPEEVLGPRIKTFDATERIWAFLSRYSM